MKEAAFNFRPVEQGVREFDELKDCGPERFQQLLEAVPVPPDMAPHTTTFRAEMQKIWDAQQAERDRIAAEEEAARVAAEEEERERQRIAAEEEAARVAAAERERQMRCAFEPQLTQPLQEPLHSSRKSWLHSSTHE